MNAVTYDTNIFLEGGRTALINPLMPELWLKTNIDVDGYHRHVLVLRKEGGRDGAQRRRDQNQNQNQNQGQPKRTLVVSGED